MTQTALQLFSKSFDVRPYLMQEIKPCFQTDLGALFGNDCMRILPHIRDEVADCIFADPPFNLNKAYGENSNDQRPEHDYITWCQSWIDQCIRITKSGGAIYLYNIPKWNIIFGSYLMGKGLEFRHNIAIDFKSSLPIQGKLYPSHYSLLYFTKGKPKTFRKIRIPIEICRHCGGEVKDYGGHRHAMNPNGANLRDVWTDIPPVRHWKFKAKERRANALSTKILDRVVEISTVPGDLIIDPFGGSGTTFAVCEKKNRHWIGMEWDFINVIKDRLKSSSIQHHHNDDYVEA